MPISAETALVINEAAKKLKVVGLLVSSLKMSVRFLPSTPELNKVKGVLEKWAELDKLESKSNSNDVALTKVYIAVMMLQAVVAILDSYARHQKGKAAETALGLMKQIADRLA